MSTTKFTKYMKYDQICKKFNQGDLSCEEVFENLSKIGYCPNLLNDDNGHWAVTFGGFQNVPLGDDTEDISTYLFIEKEKWHNTIREALLYSLEND